MLYNEKYFYTLHEVVMLSPVYEGTGDPLPFDSDLNYSFSNLLSDFDLDVPSKEITGINENEWKVQGSPSAYGLLHKLWMYIFNKYEYEFVGFGDSATPAISNPSIQKFWKMLLHKMVESYPRYKELLDLYNDEKDHLMDDVKSWTKFNDAPQMANQYDSNEYVSNYTEYGNQYASKIARIKEIDDEMRNLMGDWCDEFARCFIEE